MLALQCWAGKQCSILAKLRGRDLHAREPANGQIKAPVASTRPQDKFAFLATTVAGGCNRPSPTRTSRSKFVLGTGHAVGDERKQMQTFDVRRAIEAAASTSELRVAPGEALRQVLMITPRGSQKPQSTMKACFLHLRYRECSVILFGFAIQIATPISPLVTFLRHRKDTFDAPVRQQPYQCHQDI
jgi:hypothetical protein